MFNIIHSLINDKFSLQPNIVFPSSTTFLKNISTILLFLYYSNYFVYVCMCLYPTVRNCLIIISKYLISIFFNIFTQYNFVCFFFLVNLITKYEIFYGGVTLTTNHPHGHTIGCTCVWGDPYISTQHVFRHQNAQKQQNKEKY